MKYVFFIFNQLLRCMLPISILCFNAYYSTKTNPNYLQDGIYVLLTFKQIVYVTHI